MDDHLHSVCKSLRFEPPEPSIKNKVIEKYPKVTSDLRRRLQSSIKNNFETQFQTENQILKISSVLQSK